MNSNNNELITKARRWESISTGLGRILGTTLAVFLGIMSIFLLVVIFDDYEDYSSTPSDTIIFDEYTVVVDEVFTGRVYTKSYSLAYTKGEKLSTIDISRIELQYNSDENKIEIYESEGLESKPKVVVYTTEKPRLEEVKNTWGILDNAEDFEY